MKSVLKAIGIGCGVLAALFMVLVVIAALQAPTITPTTAGTPVAAPSGSATVGRIGAQIRYPDGWTLVVQRLEEQPTPSPWPAFAATPGPGMRLVVVTVRFDNAASSPNTPEPSDFKMQDSNGVRRSPFRLSPERSDVLKDNELGPGGFVVGTIVFEAPRDDRILTLVYQPRRRAELAVQLY
jgi:hypothetical protein